MKSSATKSFIVGAIALLGLSAAVQATPAITLLGDTGTFRTTSYNATNGVVALSVNPLINPYGVPPLTPVNTITPGVAWSVVLPLPNPATNFMAFASNSGGPTGKSIQMDGKLDFYITLDTPAKLTVNIFENGAFNTTGNGTFDLTGGAVVSGVNANLIVQETRSNSFSGPVFNQATKKWTLSDQITGFGANYTTYKVSIDNTLLAEALSSGVASSGFIDKSGFSLVFTTDGSNGGGPPVVPEPASLGVLALGGLALLARRRRA